jgi:acetyl-CoA carboxylase carboxyltransferase component
MDLTFNQNEDHLRSLLSQMEQRAAQVRLGGGKKSIEKQKAKNKKTARERIEYLIDKDSTFIELGLFAGYELYEDQGGCPAGGTVAGIGIISGRQAVIVANDQTVKAGAGSRSQVKKIYGCKRSPWKTDCLSSIW